MKQSNLVSVPAGQADTQTLRSCITLNKYKIGCICKINIVVSSCINPAEFAVWISREIRLDVGVCNKLKFTIVEEGNTHDNHDNGEKYSNDSTENISTGTMLVWVILDLHLIGISSVKL